MGLRLGEHPRCCVTTTPRPLPLIKAMVKDPRVVTIKGSTYANLHNLAPVFQRAVLDRRSEEHTSELQSLMRISYAVFCLKKKNKYIIISDIHLIKILQS